MNLPGAFPRKIWAPSAPLWVAHHPAEVAGPLMVIQPGKVKVTKVKVTVSLKIFAHLPFANLDISYSIASPNPTWWRIGRVLHDSMDLQANLPEEYRSWRK